MISRWPRITCAAALLLSLHPCPGQDAAPAADGWWTGAFRPPPWVSTNQVDPARFGQLKAEGIAGKLRVFWQPAALNTNTSVTLWASADEPGHWPARDWRSQRMEARGRVWDGALLVDNVDVPVIYFITAAENGVTNVSPPRLCRPRAAGLEEPTRLFWPFLEGFEQPVEGWWVVADEPDFGAIAATEAGRTGKRAAVVKLPARKTSVTVATTRVRGWQLVQHGASGVRLWLRTGGGAAKLRSALHTNTGAPAQALSPGALDIALDERWQKVDLPFAAFPGLSPAGVDLLTLEFVSGGATEFFIDDLQLIGPWKLE